MNTIVLSIDPGKKKCGMAVVDNRLTFITGKVVDNQELLKEIAVYQSQYKINKIILGNGTNYEEIYHRVKKHFPSFSLTKVAEKNTTMQARKLYFETYPPKGIAKILPISLRIPPRAYDDFAAFVIAERYFRNSKELQVSNNKK